MIGISIWVSILKKGTRQRSGADHDPAGLSLRELIHEFKHETLVLFKCCLLQSKVPGPIYALTLLRSLAVS